MEKKLYNTPLTEAMPLKAFGSIMITSVGMEGNNMPGEPGSGSSGAPARRTEVF